MPTTFCVCTRDNRWISQKLSMEKNTIGNEPYIEKATVLGSFFVLIEDIIKDIPIYLFHTFNNFILSIYFKIQTPVNTHIHWSYFFTTL